MLLSSTSYDKPYRKNPSLEFFFLRTKNSLLKFDENNYKSSKELLSSLAKVNQQIGLTKSNVTSFKFLIESDYYLLLSRLNVIRLNQDLFDEHTLSFKRLVIFLLGSCIEEEDILRRLSKAFGIYLINFTSYYEMRNYQIIYIKKFITNLIELFNKYPKLIVYWLDSVNSDDEIRKMLIQKNSKLIEANLSNYKYFPLYDMIRSFIFVDEDDMQFTNLINLVQINDDKLINWFLNDSDLLSIFIEKFTDFFNQSCLIKSEVLEFNKFLLLFYSILDTCPSSLRYKLWNVFEARFINEILQINLNNISIIYIFKIIRLTVPFNLEDFLTSLFKNQLIINFLNQITKVDYEIKSLLLEIFNEIILNHEQLVIEMFGNEEEVADLIDVNDLRVKAMKLSQNNELSNLSQLFSQGVQKIKSMKFIQFNDDKFLSHFLLTCLLSFYQNLNGFNKILIELINNLHYKISLFQNFKFALIIDFLFEAYQNYREIFKKIELDKYDTMKSFKESNYEYLVPNNEFLNKLKFDIHIRSNELLEFDRVNENLNLFNELILKLYVNCKCKNIIHNSNSKKY